MGRRIRIPITILFSTNEKIWYKKARKLTQRKPILLCTAIIYTGNQNILTNADQIRNRIEEDVCMEGPKVDDGLNFSVGDRLEEHMEENVAESDTQYDESSEDKIKLHSPLRRIPHRYLEEVIDD